MTDIRTVPDITLTYSESQVLDLFDVHHVADGVFTLHQYYFTKNGSLCGLKPGTCNVVVYQGPFISFDKAKRILTSATDKFHLPLEQAEKSKTPNLIGQTSAMLAKLSV
jgi:hypothetical protein